MRTILRVEELEVLRAFNVPLEVDHTTIGWMRYEY